MMVRVGLQQLAWSLPTPLRFGHWAHGVPKEGPTVGATHLDATPSSGGKVENAQDAIINCYAPGVSANV